MVDKEFKKEVFASRTKQVGKLTAWLFSVLVVTVLTLGLSAFLLGCTCLTPTKSPMAPEVRVVEHLATPYKASIDITLSNQKVRGSGIIVENKAGRKLYVVTAWHVVDGVTDSIFVRDCYDVPINKICSYKEMIVKHKIEDADIALLESKLTLTEDGPFALVAKADPKLGETIFMIGAPSGRNRSITKGILSNFLVKANGMKLYVTDAVIFFGNSGGGMFTERGELVGVAHAIILFNAELGPFSFSTGVVPGTGMVVALQHIQEVLRGIP
jgi:S1-C subfamily serine protease